MKTFNRSLIALMLGSFALGCAESKEPVDDTFTELGSIEDKADQFGGRMTLVGTLAYDQSLTVRHQANKWSAIKFLGNTGDRVVVDVTSRNGDTVAWLVDKSNEILAFNDDYGNGTNSHLEYTLQNAANTTFFIVVRDYYRKSMTFTVSLKNALPAGACGSDDVCAATEFCGWNGVACVRAPCDVAFDICQPRHTAGAGCSRDRECAQGLSCREGICAAGGAAIGDTCRASEDCANGFCGCADSTCSTSVCKAFAAEGESCGGFRPAHLHQSCSPAFACVAPYDIIADIPGHCGDMTTVAEVLANPAAFDGRFIAVKGIIDSSQAICTKIACSQANPCCNQCSARSRAFDNAGQVGSLSGIFLQDDAGVSLGCQGNECTVATQCTVTPGNYWVAGWFRLDGGVTPSLSIEARYAY